MGSLASILLALLCSMVIALPMIQGVDESPQAVAEWYSMRPLMKETETKIHFYMHVTVEGQCISSVKVTQANIPTQTNFGSIFVSGNPMTVGPDPNSMTLGEAQGTYTGAAMQQVGLLINWNFIFTSGEFKGSSLSVSGQDQISNTYRELSIVGGSGVFRLARGTAITQTYSVNATSLNAVIEFTAFVLYYCMI